MQVLDRGGKAVALGSCLSQVLDHGSEAVARGAIFLNRRYLIVVPRPLTAAPLAVRRLDVASVART